MADKKLKFDVIVTKEKATKRSIFVAEEVTTGIVSQGFSYEEATENLKEALSIHLERTPSIRKLILQEQKNEETYSPIITRLFL